MAWLFAEEHGADSAALLRLLDDGEALVPSLWHLDVANALLVGERRRRIAGDDAARFLALLANLPIFTEEVLPTAVEAHALARRFDLTAYDAAYLALAARATLPLATFDAALRRVAGAAGIAVLG